VRLGKAAAVWAATITLSPALPSAAFPTRPVVPAGGGIAGREPGGRSERNDATRGQSQQR
jgi:hypothetical protein